MENYVLVLWNCGFDIFEWKKNECALFAEIGTRRHGQVHRPLVCYACEALNIGSWLGKSELDPNQSAFQNIVHCSCRASVSNNYAKIFQCIILDIYHRNRKVNVLPWPAQNLTDLLYKLHGPKAIYGILSNAMKYSISYGQCCDPEILFPKLHLLFNVSFYHIVSVH